MSQAGSEFSTSACVIDMLPPEKRTHLYQCRLSGEFMPHLFQPAVRRHVRSLGGEVIFPLLGSVECRLVFRGTEDAFNAFVDWLRQAPSGLGFLASIEAGEAESLISALKGEGRRSS